MLNKKCHQNGCNLEPQRFVLGLVSLLLGLLLNISGCGFCYISSEHKVYLCIRLFKDSKLADTSWKLSHVKKKLSNFKIMLRFLRCSDKNQKNLTFSYILFFFKFLSNIKIC